MTWPFALCLSLLAIILGVTRKLHLGLVMLAGGITLLIAAGMKPVSLMETAQLTLTDRATLLLLVSIVLIEVLGHILGSTGTLQKMITCLEQLVGNRRILTALLPAMIGILTVPGGAVFSAPLVRQAAEGTGLSPSRQAAANLWFRHALYFMYPLFPSVILAAELAAISVSAIFIYNLSLSITALLVAYLWIFRGIPAKTSSTVKSVIPHGDGSAARGTALLNFLASFAPLGLVLILVLAFRVYFPLALIAGIITAVFTGIPLRKGCLPALKKRIQAVPAGIRFRLALVIPGVMFYKHSLEYSGIITMLGEAIISLGIPLVLMMFIVPATVGLVTGENSASVAIVFPLFLPLFDAASSLYPAYVAFIYFSSAWGHIFTPTHPCFSLTVEFFKVSFAGVLRHLFPAALATAILAVIQFLVIANAL